MARQGDKKKCEPLLKLHGRILFRNSRGATSDVTSQNMFGLKKLADDGALAVHILSQCKKRLDLLFMAAESRSQVDASLVRLAVEDVRSELDEHSELSGYVHQMHQLFSHAEGIAPVHAPHMRNDGGSLPIIKSS